jgi:diaminohydroxyphosphoribosylaminopyrimidine deaminase / 5-amino-6-(5-phosphoribosylamino)uracil reductase
LKSDKNEQFMALCLRLAEKGRGFVSPNPLVGAVLVRSERVVASGFHRRFGGAHAEVECLQSHKGSLSNATLYVNLEPCSHHGKTPPCVDLIINSGIRNVVVGMVDPNPVVAGRGIRKLRRAGVKVVLGVLAEEAKILNRSFIISMTKQRPFVHVKIAQTLDGKIGRKPRATLQISGKESLELVHKWRSEHDAVLVGAGTIHADDPFLTVRLTAGRDPAVVILDGGLSLDPRRRVLKSATSRDVIVFARQSAARRKEGLLRQLRSCGATVVPLKSMTNYLPLKLVLRKLHRLGVGSILVEGGSEVFTQFLENQFTDLLSVFVAPKMLGVGIPTFGDGTCRGPRGIDFSHYTPSVRAVGTDVLLQYDLTRSG